MDSRGWLILLHAFGRSEGMTCWRWLSSISLEQQKKTPPSSSLAGMKTQAGRRKHFWDAIKIKMAPTGWNQARCHITLDLAKKQLQCFPELHDNAALSIPSKIKLSVSSDVGLHLLLLVQVQRQPRRKEGSRRGASCLPEVQSCLLTSSVSLREVMLCWRWVKVLNAASAGGPVCLERCFTVFLPHQHLESCEWTFQVWTSGTESKPWLNPPQALQLMWFSTCCVHSFFVVHSNKSALRCYFTLSLMECFQCTFSTSSHKRHSEEGRQGFEGDWLKYLSITHWWTNQICLWAELALASMHCGV